MFRKAKRFRKKGILILYLTDFMTLSMLRPPHTSRFFVGRQKICTCRLVYGEFRQVCDKIGACRAISNSAKSQNVLSASVRWTKTICRGSRVPQPMRNCHESHVNKSLFQLGGDRLGSKPNAVSRDKTHRLVCRSLYEIATF